MKRIFYFLLLILSTHPLIAQSLLYSECSAGLGTPEWENGRAELEFADINQDGFPDFITLGDHGSPFPPSGEQGIMVYFGDGNGLWSLHMEGYFGYGGIAVGDVNNDGLWDVGYGMHHNYSSNDLGDQLIEVALGNGTGTGWIPWDNGLAENGEDWGMFGTDFADVDNDGDLDLGSISFGCCAGVHVYLNNNDGTWEQSFGFLGGNSNGHFIFGDVNNDGCKDFVTTHEAGSVWLGDGNGDFTCFDAGLPASPFNGPSLGDIDNDGDQDLAFVKTNLEVWGWDQDQEIWTDYSGNLPEGGDYEATQLCDMNGDGFMDLAAFGNGLFTLWLGNGNGTWTQETSFTVPQPGNCQAFTVGGDIDHNGFPDLLLVSEEGSWPNYQNHLRCYKENSTPQNLTVFPAFPKGLEKFQAQSVQFIDWLSGIPENEASWVKIQYTRNGTNGPWHLIGDSLPNSGRIQWIVPQAESSDCYIQITVYTATDQAVATTPQPFTITAGNGIYADFVADTTQGNCPLTVQFTNLSSPNANHWEWDFECDGLIDSYEENPLFTYASPGLFSVKLTVSDGNTTNSRIRENYITINDWTGISSMKKSSNLHFFPNPLKGAGTLVFSLREEASAAVVSLYNFNGIRVWEQQTQFLRTGKHSLMIDFCDSGIPSGIYYLTLQTGKTSGRIKVIVQ